MILTERVLNNLLLGNLDFLDYFSSSSKDELISDLRSLPVREQVLFNSFNKIIEKDPKFAFMISCDVKDYENMWRRYLGADNSILFDFNCLMLFLLNADWSKKYILEHIYKLVIDNKAPIFTIIRYTLKTGDRSILNKLAYHLNLNVRGLFMSELIDTHSYLVFELYDNLIDYFVKLDNDGNLIEVMNEEYVSKIASLALYNGLGEDVYNEIRDFIFVHYKKNSLASALDMRNKEVNDELTINQEMLVKDIDQLFETSKNYKYVIATKYAKYLDSTILKDFMSKIYPFVLIDEQAVSMIFLNGLGDNFLEYIDKYLELSTGAKVIRDAGAGTCSRAFRVGDYVIKCSHKKWSMEKDLCPSGYLFAKNYEEDIVRKNSGEVTGAIEVQRFLTKPLVVEDYVAIMNYQEALRQMGYYTKDVLTAKDGGANCYYLNSYLEADCDNPEELPDWFKKEPVVLVDRDLVFKLENKNPKLKAINLK